MKWLVVFVVVLAAVAGLWALLPAEEYLRRILQWVESFGVWAAVAYFAVFFVLAVIAFPTTPLTIGAGLLFNLWVAIAVASSAALAASVASFLFARHAARDWAQKKIEGSPNCCAMVETVEEESLKIIILLRLNPFIPASVKNYCLGIAEISLWTYMLGTAIGQTPIVLAYVYLGWAGSETLASGDEPLGPMQIAFIVGGIIVSAALLLVITWYGKRRLDSVRPA
ncbi:MAG: TVP38/TMEM64 family protein [Phycisphaerales bacterium]